MRLDLVELWNELCTCSKRAMRKTKGKYGRTYFYSPRGDLLKRIAEKRRISHSEAFNLLQELRQEILKREDRV